MRAFIQHYWDLIRRAKIWLAITLALFCLAFVGAVIVGLARPSLIAEMADHLPGSNETGFPHFIHLARHNVTSMLIAWCGSLVLAIGPLLDTLGMGFLLGGLLLDAPFTFWFVTIVPHGIIEVPAILLGNAFFLKFGLRWAFQKGATARKRAFVSDFRDSLKVALLCAALFCVAATIETFATPKIATAYLAPYAKEHFAGIGVEFAIREHQLTLARVLPGGPASRAGLSSGLLIQKIDGSATTGKSAEECDAMVHGRADTAVKLEVVDVAHRMTNAVELVREFKP